MACEEKRNKQKRKVGPAIVEDEIMPAKIVEDDDCR
jgi:hypothetical protein